MTVKQASAGSDRKSPAGQQAARVAAAPDEHTPMLEWVVAALGALLVSVTVGYLLYQASTAAHTPPDISVTVDEVLALNNGYLVKIRALNEGGSTAQGVRVEGTLRDGDQAVETGEMTIDYLPARSSRDGGLLFSRDPAGFALEIRPLGYSEP